MIFRQLNENIQLKMKYETVVNRNNLLLNFRKCNISKRKFVIFL